MHNFRYIWRGKEWIFDFESPDWVDLTLVYDEIKFKSPSWSLFNIKLLPTRNSNISERRGSLCLFQTSHNSDCEIKSKHREFQRNSHPRICTVTSVKFEINGEKSNPYMDPGLTTAKYCYAVSRSHLWAVECLRGYIRKYCVIYHLRSAFVHLTVLWITKLDLKDTVCTASNRVYSREWFSCLANLGSLQWSFWLLSSLFYHSISIRQALNWILAIYRCVHSFFCVIPLSCPSLYHWTSIAFYGIMISLY